MRATYRVIARHGLAFRGASGDRAQAMTPMDAFDDSILRILAREGRITNQALAARIGLSSSATLRRVQAMERTGLIRGYRAVIDPDRAGIGFTAYVAVGLNDHTKRGQEAFERGVAAARQVRECHNVTGTVEYLLRIEARDLAAYKHFHTEVLGVLPQVATLTTYVVMGSPVDERA